MAQWQWNNDSSVYQAAVDEMVALGLPEGLIYYWMACFYASYELLDGGIDYDAIRDVFLMPQGTFGEKLYPQPWQLVAPSRVASDSSGYQSTPFALESTLEIMSGAILEEAIRALRDVRNAKGQSHPLFQYVNKAKVMPNEQRQEAIRRYTAGELSFEGMLREEWLDGNNQAALQRIGQGGYGLEAKKLTRELRTMIYNRVASRLRRAGIKPALEKKGRWAQSE